MSILCLRNRCTAAGLLVALPLALSHLAVGQELPKLPKPGEGAPDAAAPDAAPDAPPQNAVSQNAALRAQIAKKLGQAQDGQFILVFSKAMPATRPANGRLPPGARRLSGDRWLEVIYQVEMTDGQEAAVDMIMMFAQHTQQHPNANYDWGLVARHNDEATAQQLLQAAQAKYTQAAITLRPRKPESLRFFNHRQGRFFQPRNFNP